MKIYVLTMLLILLIFVIKKNIEWWASKKFMIENIVGLLITCGSVILAIIFQLINL